MKGFDRRDHGLYIVYNFLLLIFSPAAMIFLAWRLMRQKAYRRGVIERFGVLPPHIGKQEENRQVIWIHAVSVGEVLASAALIKVIRQRIPHVKLVVSTVTVTGRTIAEQKIPEIDHFFYFPFDFPWATRRVVHHLRPDLFVFVETELWPNLLRNLKKNKIPSIMVNGRVSPRSFKRYRRLKWFFRRVLQDVDRFAVQTQRDARYLKELGADPLNIECTGNMKYDQEIKQLGEKELGTLLSQLGIEKGTRMVVVGSTHEGEEEIIFSHFKEMENRWGPFQMILAPRHLERIPGIEKLLEVHQIPYIRKSQLVQAVHQGKKGIGIKGVILLDTLGELASYYQLAMIVFVGGSLVPIGGHNVLEPASFGKMSFFGPYMENFSEIGRLMVERGGGVQVKDAEELMVRVEQVLQEPGELERRGKAALRVVTENRGAVEKNFLLVERFLGTQEQR